ncbi:MAG: FAD-dependent oxidoreductase [Planctomycetota bacterium]|jgi:NADPH-dependent glutamate synthase beta subunit-like oxidoreductase/2,4-dienoyl-CoA reductase-like NADH-dependent reductase (Old Yellow Enzyme family)
MWEFRLRDTEDLKQLSMKLGVNVEAIEDVSILTEPVQAGKLVIPNSLAVHPMEGCDGDSQGRPGRLTLRRYERFAAGGAGLIWAEATAVVPEGRANPRQLWIHEKNKESFASMVKMMRQAAAESMGPDHKPVIVLQLTHSGRYSKPESTAHPIIAQRDPYRDPLVPQPKPDPNRKSRIPDDWPLVTDEYLDKLRGAYVEAARIAFEVGFDAVDIKSCHGYLINELFGCRDRKGKYGGSFENRTRFPLEVIDKINQELGEDAAVTMRLGIYDAIPYPYGWAVDKDDYTKPDLTEPKKLISLLQQRGLKLINVTIANPYYNPHVGRPFNETIVGGYDEPEHPLVGVDRLVNLVGEIQKQFHDIAMIGTGYSWLRILFANVAAANKTNGLTTLVGAGRMAFAYPDFAKDIINDGKMYFDKVCVSCSACTQIMRDAGMTGCVVRDNEVYGPIFKHGRMSDKDNLVRLASDCRKCQEPTCQLGCPAGVDIPKFINQFLDGEEKAAYQTLRETNIFPEVCAWLCPVEQQCEGNCLQRFIGDGPLPIAEIQRYLAEQANKNGWSKLDIPKGTTGKNVAIIGAGPAGLSCAAKLLEAGHNVTIFDAGTEFGGMIESVIPAERQNNSLRNEIAAIFADVSKERMILRLGKTLNSDFNLDNITEEGFDAVFIGMGLPNSVSIGGKNENIDGLWNAMDFLSAARKADAPNLKGKSAAVIGGGNTAMDAATTAKRLGAKDVYIIYRRSFKEMPAWSAERDQAINKGVHFLILTQPVGFNSANDKLTGIKVCPTRLGEPDKSGRRRPELVEKSAYVLDMDIVVEAIGQEPPESIDEILPGIDLKDGLIQTKEGALATSRQGIYAGGDLVRGASTVVAAVADGMAAANEINEYLKQ